MTQSPLSGKSPTGPSRWGMVALLVCITALNLTDRQLPFIMAEPISREFGLSDTQLGLLGGVAFSLVYALAALPIARLADRAGRGKILASCLFAWSAFTGMGALASNFVQLMLSRAGVAIGEAGANPCSHAILAELFPDRRRPLAVAIVTAGVPLGVLMGMAMGGWLLSNFTWRQVLAMAAIPGFVLATLLLLLFRERPRHGRGEAHAPAVPPFGSAIRILAKDRRFVWISIAATFSIFATSGGAAFGAPFFMRFHNLDIASAGLAVGLILGLTSAIGSIAAGMLGARLSSRDIRWLMWLPAIGAFIQVPFYVTSWLVADLHLALILQTLGWLAGSSHLAMSYTAVQTVTAPHMRAFGSAALQLQINLFGNVLGPIAVGALSDALGGGSGRGLGLALAISGTMLGIASFGYFRAAKWLNASLPANGPDRATS